MISSSFLVQVPFMANTEITSVQSLKAQRIALSLHDYDVQYRANNDTRDGARQLCPCQAINAAYTAWPWLLSKMDTGLPESFIATAISDIWTWNLNIQDVTLNKEVPGGVAYHAAYILLVETFDVVMNGSCHLYNVTDVEKETMFGYLKRQSEMVCPSGLDDGSRHLLLRWTVPIFWWLDDWFTGGFSATRQRSLLAANAPCHNNTITPPHFCYVGKA